jgi:predicted esterase YcpF (UPF0227 family)
MRALTTHLLYLHGFRSSPQSMKARKVMAWLAQHRPDVQAWCPQLPPSPTQAMQMVAERLAHWPDEGVAVMGSSLGGFYATWVAERVPAGARAQLVLINPAVDPARDLSRYIGEHTSWHDPEDRFFFRAEFVDELRTLYCTSLHRPTRYQIWAATGDEVLDWREMQAKYAVCTHLPAPAGLHIVPGPDHALSDFDLYWPLMAEHLGLLA